VGRTRMRLDEMDCADIMRKAVQRKRSRSIARRESFSGTEEDLKKFRDAVEANNKDSDLQKDIEEYAVKVREIRAGKEEGPAEEPSSSTEKVELTPRAQTSKGDLVTGKTVETETSNNQLAGAGEETKVLETKETDGKKTEAAEESTEDVGVEKEEGPSEEKKESLLQTEIKKPNLDSTEVEDNPITMTDEAKEESEQAPEIPPQKEEQNNVENVNVNLETDTEEIAKECEQIGEAVTDELEDPNEAENQTEDVIEKSEQIPVELTESENVVDFAPEETQETRETCETLEAEETADLKNDISENNCQQEPENIETEIKLAEGEDVKINDDFINSDSGQAVDEVDDDPNNKDTPVQDEVDEDPENSYIHEDVKDEVDENKIIPEAVKDEVGDDPENKDIPDAVKDEVDDDSKDTVISDHGEDTIRDDDSVKIIVKNDQEIIESEESNFLSIVDRIKNDITTLRTISKEGAKTAANILREVDTEDTEESPAELKATEEKTEADQQVDVSQTTPVIPGEPEVSDHKQSGLKVALDRVSREKSASHVQIPQELSSHLINLSSANISEQLRKSCSNIVARSQDQELSKEFLLKKLEELLRQERKQVTEDLKRRKEQLLDTKETNAIELDSLKKKHKEELKKLRSDHSMRSTSFENDFLDEMERLKKEIELLENEKENLVGPNQLISDSLSSRSDSSAGSRQLSELESDLECCSCSYICRPPCQIYQCPEGDLLCEYCTQEKTRKFCPKCGISLAGPLTRNKGLEKIAAKYFASQ